MKSSNKIAIVIGIIVLISALTLYFLFNSKEEINWAERYLPREKMPYDTYVIEQLLRNNSQGKPFEVVEDSTHLHLSKEANNELLVFIGRTFFYDEKDLKAIREFVAGGNTFFLSAEGLDRNLFDTLFYYDHLNDLSLQKSDSIYDEYIYTHDEEYRDEINNYTIHQHPVYYSDILLGDFASSGIEMNLEGTDISTSLYYIYEFDTIPNSWSYFNPEWIENYSQSAIKPKGSLRAAGTILPWNNYYNYIEISHGKGKILFHLHPKVFSNYFLKQEGAFDYTSSIFKDLSPSKIIWAEENRKYDYLKNLDKEDYRSSPDESFMEFILSEPSLRYAWYTLLFAVFLYLLFGAKRKQRTIPVLEKKNNTSIEYAEVIAELFLEEDDHSKLVRMKKELFRSFLRDRYGVKTPNNYKELDEPFLQHLRLKSGIEIQEIKALFENWFHIEAVGIVYTSDMLEFNKKLESFYQNSK